MCRIFSADCIISGFTASQSPLFCEAKYSGLHFAQWLSVLLRICFQSFSLRYVLKSMLKKNIFNLCPTSFLCLLHFIFFSVFVLTSPRKINYLSIIYGHLQAVLRGCFAKVFYTHHYNWKVTSRLSGYFTKILQKFFRYNWFLQMGT